MTDNTDIRFSTKVAAWLIVLAVGVVCALIMAVIIRALVHLLGRV